MFRGDDEFLDPQPEGWGSVKRTAAAVSCGRFSLASAGGLYFSWSPLAVLGGVDAGGQNVHVAALAAAGSPRS